MNDTHIAPTLRSRIFKLKAYYPEGFERTIWGTSCGIAKKYTQPRHIHS